MDELVRALRHFITRDLIFLVGGSSVVASFVYTFGVPPTPKDPVVLYLLVAGISYVVGYALQDAGGLLPVLPTTAPRKLNWYQRRLYKWYTREQWEDIPEKWDFQRAEEGLQCERQIAWLERITSLRQVCTTVAPCWVVSAGLLGLRWSKKVGQDFDLPAALAGLCIAVVLGHLAWVKAAQEAQYLHRHPPGSV